jgi:hypothetical protein
MSDNGSPVPGQVYEVVAEVPTTVEAFAAAIFAEVTARGRAWPAAGGLVEYHCNNCECSVGSVRVEVRPGGAARRTPPQPSCPLCLHPLVFTRKLRAVVLVPAQGTNGGGDGDGR